MWRTEKANRWIVTTVAGVSLLALSACEQLENFEFPFSGASEATGDAAAPDLDLGDTETRDVEAPEVFQKNEAGLWDGRPSLGGVWVAHPDVTDPERVIIRNEDNGRFVVGALFRRERENPGPALQVSSDAAEELGMLAGSPAQLNVTALRREASTVAPPATTDFDTPIDTETVDLAGPSDVSASPLDETDAVVAGAAAAIAASADAASADVTDAVVPPAPSLPAAPVSNGAAAAIDALAATVDLAAAEAAFAPPASGASDAIASLAPVGAPLDARGPLADPVAPIDVAPIATAPLDAPSTDLPLPEPAAAPAIAPVAPVPEPAPSSASSALEKPFIQVGIFSLESNADGAAARLRGDGMVATVREQNSDGTTFWRVLVGPAPNAADRTAILAKVQALGFSDAYFVSD